MLQLHCGYIRKSDFMATARKYFFSPGSRGGVDDANMLGNPLATDL